MDVALAVAAEDVLAAAVAALTASEPVDPENLTASETLAASLLPDVRVIQVGPSWAWDPCERVVVHTDAVQPTSVPANGVGSPPFSPAGPLVPVARFRVTLLYCIPTVTGEGKLPSTAEIAEASERLLVGGMTLWRGLARARSAGTLVSSDVCSSVDVGELSARGPAGGYAGWELPVSVDISASEVG